MKNWKVGLAAFALIAFVAGAFAQNRMEGQGALWSIGSGGSINIESGGAIKVAGTDKTTALGAAVTTPVAGVAAGYKVARGETALDGSNPTPVTTGLTSIVGCALTIKATAAPGVGTSVVTYDTSSGTMNMYGWKVTGTGDATLIASTGTETIGWVCVGT
jgi:hypothetical protein